MLVHVPKKCDEFVRVRQTYCPIEGCASFVLSVLAGARIWTSQEATANLLPRATEANEVKKKNESNRTISRGDQIPQSTIASAKNGWLRILPYNIYTVVLTFPVIESPLKSCKADSQVHP